MAIFQFHMQIIGRSEGRSAVAAAAYRSAGRIENRYTGILEDYTRKGWVEYSEVMLPAGAPEAFRDRAVLWNSVEEVEKGRDARLAREIEVALPKELSMEENIRLIREFVQDTFVSDGMAADVNIHNPPVTDESGFPVDEAGNRVTDKKDMLFRNPHAHILLTVRSFGPDGKWMPKTQKEYICKRGDETAALTADEFRQAKAEGWQKEYQYYMGQRKVWMTPSEAFEKNLVRVSKNPRSTPYGRRDARMERWNSPEALKTYRLSWEEHVNRALERAGRPERVDCRSYEDQGVDTVSGIHLGPHASRMDGSSSDRRRINEDIKSLNQANEAIRETLDEIEEKIREKEAGLYEVLAERLGKLRADILSARYSLESLKEQQALLEKDIGKLKESVGRVRTARENVLEKNRMSEEKISRLKEEQKEKFPVWSTRPAEIGAAIQAEQDSIRFRKERFAKILDEEGFSDIREFQQEAQILRQMEQESERLKKEISFCEETIDEHTRRYEELCGFIPEDSASSEEFRSRKETWSRRYEQKAADHIQRKSGHLRMDIFRRAVHETDRTLNHAFYLAGKAGYLLNKVKEAVDEQEGDRRRRP